MFDVLRILLGLGFIIYAGSLVDFGGLVLFWSGVLFWLVYLGCFCLIGCMVHVLFCFGLMGVGLTICYLWCLLIGALL